LNPLLEGPDVAVLDLIAPVVFAVGYRVDPTTFDLIPHALETIPSIENGGVVDNGDGTISVTVTVAADARWADGPPITAADLEFTWRTIVDPALPIRRELVHRYSSIDPASVVADGRTIRFTMAATPDYELLFELIVPRHSVEGSDFAADWNDTMWAAGGPFEFAAWQPGQYLEMVRNDAYWDTGSRGEPLPYLERLIFRFFEPGDGPDPRLVDAFSTGDIDVVVFGEETAPAVFQNLEGAVVEVAPGMLWDHLNFQFGPGNRNPESLNQYVEFRRAIAHAIDRNQLAIEVGGTPLTGALRLYGKSFTESPWAEYDYDPEKVKGLLFTLENEIDRDLFAGDGPRVVLTVTSDGERSVELGGALVTMLRTAGFDAELQLEDSALFFGSTVDNGTWDLASWRFIGGQGVGGGVEFVQMFDPDGLPFVGTNYYRWGTIDSTVSGDAVDSYRDTLFRLRTTIDPAEISALLLEAEALLAEQVVLIPLLASGGVGIARHEILSGPTVNPVQGAMWNVDEWRLGEG
jgi:peptide/nickel transport system substrate-binding protein